MVKNPSRQEADQLAIYKRGRGVEPGAAEKQLQLVVRTGLEPGTSGFQVRRPNHSTTLPPEGANSPILSPYFSYKSTGEKVLKYQENSP